MKIPRLASLYLMRHGTTEDGPVMDPARTLTTEGLDEVQTMARFCLVAKVRPAEVICSPFRRSRDTADFMVDHLETAARSTPALQVSSAVLPNADPKKAVQTIRQACLDEGGQDVLVVTHQPLIDEMLVLLLGLDMLKDGCFEFKQASIARMDLDVVENTVKMNRLRWFVTPKLAGRMM